MNQDIQEDNTLKNYNEKWDINSNSLETCTYNNAETIPPPSHPEIIYNPKRN